MSEIIGLDHVQLAMPPGQEGVARSFYAEVLGMVEEPKPANLAVRGGVWFRSGSLRVHLGVEPEFRAARKAHPAFLVRGLSELAARCAATGFDPVADEPLEGFDRFYVFDPFGNRIELLEPRQGHASRNFIVEMSTAVSPHADLPTLRGASVQLRQLLDSDSEAVHEIFGDAEVVRFMAVPLLETLNDALAFLARIHQGRVAGTLFQWGIVKRGDSSVCGTCTLAGIDRVNERAELGFALGRRHWGSGVVQEAVPLVIEHAFTGMGLNRLEADADPRNVKSLRILEKLGFSREGYQRERYLVGGERQDSVLFGLRASEWRHRRRDA